MEIKNLEPRKYQDDIFNNAINKNTLVVLPTGIGKTAIAIMIANNRINKHEDSKILILSPTKPLCAQHVKSFLKFTDLNEDEIILYTGILNPKKREKIWSDGKIIIATPQTIKSDIENNRISLNDVSLLVIDEAHRSRMNYANTYVTDIYEKNSRYPRILALTASPGSTKERIEEICENLKINSVEIRTYDDEDIKPYVKEKEIDWVHVNLPKKFEEIKKLIEDMKNQKTNDLRKIIPHKTSFNKKDILNLQFQFRKSIKKGNKLSFWGISITAQLLKLSYALELVETQGIKQLIEYWDKLSKEETKAAKTIVADSRIKKAIQLSMELKEENHPKMDKLKDLILDELSKNKESKIIVFANYRNTVNEIYNLLKKEDIKPVVLIGQKEGLSQKEQINTIKKFAEDDFNVLICTSIGEEGLDITSANLAIFYEPVPSEIRMIQRGGRVGRMIEGKIIFLITKKTRDEAYYWASKSKEKTMKKTLYDLKENLPSQMKLKEF